MCYTFPRTKVYTNQSMSLNHKSVLGKVRLVVLVAKTELKLVYIVLARECAIQIISNRKKGEIF
jgi:hypothetical protein